MIIVLLFINLDDYVMYVTIKVRSSFFLQAFSKKLNQKCMTISAYMFEVYLYYLCHFKDFSLRFKLQKVKSLLTFLCPYVAENGPFSQLLRGK